MSKKICLLYKQPQNNKLISILLLIIITISILLTYKYKAYNVLNIIGIIKCEKTCYIDTSIPYENISIIDKKTILSYKDKKYKIIDVENNMTERPTLLSEANPYTETIIT